MEKHKVKLSKMNKLDFYREWERTMNRMNSNRMKRLKKDKKCLTSCIRFICPHSTEIFEILKNECKTEKQELYYLNMIYWGSLYGKNFSNCKNLKDIRCC